MRLDPCGIDVFVGRILRRRVTHFSLHSAGVEDGKGHRVSHPFHNEAQLVLTVDDQTLRGLSDSNAPLHQVGHAPRLTRERCMILLPREHSDDGHRLLWALLDQLRVVPHVHARVTSRHGSYVALASLLGIPAILVRRRPLRRQRRQRPRRVRRIELDEAVARALQRVWANAVKGKHQPPPILALKHERLHLFLQQHHWLVGESLSGVDVRDPHQAQRSADVELMPLRAASAWHGLQLSSALLLLLGARLMKDADTTRENVRRFYWEGGWPF